MSNIQSTTGSDFERDVLTADRPVLVDFWAPWSVDTEIGNRTESAYGTACRQDEGSWKIIAG